MADKSYRDMSDDELRAAHREWSQRVDEASGWTSAFFAAQQCAAIQRTLRDRGLAPEPEFVREVKHG